MALGAVAVTALFLGASAPSGAERQDEFDSQLEYLRRQWMPDVGKDAVVDAFKDFIEEYQDDPRVAKAMLHLAGLMENSDPQKGIYPDRAAALGWYRKAAGRAVPGSETWIKAQFMVQGRVVYSSPAEARGILKQVAAHAQGDSLTLARVESALYTVCRSEDDLDGAERHCRRILSWYDDPARIPTEPLRKRDLDMLIASCASAMMEALRVAPMPKADRAKRIQGLMRDYGFQSLEDAGTEALKELETMPEFRRRVPLAAEAGWIAWLRWTMVLVSVVVFLSLGWLFLIRRRRQA
jgi:hypothetical protein